MNIEQLKNRKCINHMDYVISDHCNLNCKGCRTFASIAKGWNVSVKQFLDDMKELKRIGFSDDLILSFFGGDPLVHPCIEVLIKLCNFNVGMLTNGKGILYKKQSFFDIIKRKNITITISYYKYSNINYDKVFKILNDNCINYANVDDNDDMYNKCEDNGVRVKKDWLLSRIDPNGNYDKQYQFDNCHSMYPIVRDGKLYKCTIFNVKALNRFNVNIELKENEDYLVLKKIKDKQELEEWLFSNTALDTCKYCGSDLLGCYNETIQWTTTERKSNEWIIDYEYVKK